MNADSVLADLMEGNRRYREGRPRGAGRDAARRAQTAAGQRPTSIVLTCSDSRVPPEIIFDAGIGEIFVVRVAGNVEDDLVTGSIEYAAAHLDVPLVLVMGHTRCGAITAVASGAEPAGLAGAFLAPLAEAFRAAEGDPGDRIEAAARRSVLTTVRRLRESAPVLAPLVREGRLKVLAALYDIETGTVEILGE